MLFLASIKIKLLVCIPQTTTTTGVSVPVCECLCVCVTYDRMRVLVVANEHSTVALVGAVAPKSADLWRCWYHRSSSPIKRQTDRPFGSSVNLLQLLCLLDSDDDRSCSAVWVSSMCMCKSVRIWVRQCYSLPLLLGFLLSGWWQRTTTAAAIKAATAKQQLLLLLLWFGGRSVSCPLMVVGRGGGRSHRQAGSTDHPSVGRSVDRSVVVVVVWVWRLKNCVNLSRLWSRYLRPASSRGCFWRYWPVFHECVCVYMYGGEVGPSERASDDEPKKQQRQNEDVHGSHSAASINLIHSELILLWLLQQK